MTGSPGKALARLAALPRGKRRHALLATLRSRLVSRFEHRLVIYRWPGLAVPPPPPGFEVRRYASYRDLPASVVEDRDPFAPPADWFRGRFAEGAVLWMGLEQGRAESCAWLIGAKNLPDWYLPLDPEDRVIYAVVTHPRSRGRGLAPAVVRALLHEEQRAEGVIYVDCRAWNRSARRAFEKLGFEHVTTMVPDRPATPVAGVTCQ